MWLVAVTRPAASDEDIVNIMINGPSVIVYTVILILAVPDIERGNTVHEKYCAKMVQRRGGPTTKPTRCPDQNINTDYIAAAFTGKWVGRSGDYCSTRG